MGGDHSAAARRIEPPARPFASRLYALGLASGGVGALLAWVASAALLPRASNDLVAAMVLGAVVGGFLFGALARAQYTSVSTGLALGAGLGVIGAAVGAFSGVVIGQYAGVGGSQVGNLVARVVTWSLAAGFLGMFLGLRWAGTYSVVPLEALLRGCAAGVLAAVLMSLPAVPDVARLAGFLVIGVGTGASVLRPVMVRSLGTIELASGAGVLGLLTHRGWIVPFHGDVEVDRMLVARSDNGHCRIVPVAVGTEPVTLGGDHLKEPLDLLNRDTLTVGSRTFLYRRFPEAGEQPTPALSKSESSSNLG